jgi:RHS repeat-associated protein
MSTVTDVRGRTVAVRQYRGPAPTPGTPGSWDQTTYTYNSKGKLAAVRDPAGNTWTYAYDLRGRQTEMVDPDKGRVTSTFDNSGRVTSTTDARGQKLFYLYDALGRKRALYQDVLGGTPRAQWVYDTIAKGQISQTTRIVGGALYQVKVLGYTDRYQPTGAQIVIPSAETGLAGTYDLHNTYNTVDGSLVSTSLPAATGDLPTETLTYNYDGLGQPTSLTSVYGSPGTSLSYVAGTAYNALGQLDQLTLDTDNTAGGRVWLAYTRELETGRLTGVRTDRDSATPNRISDVRFSYDHAGNVLKIADVAPDPVDDTQCFGYDYLRRLTEAWTPASGDCNAARSVSALGGPAPYWHSWTFDTASVGNRKTQTVHTAAGDATTTYTYPVAGSPQPHAVSALTGAQTAQFRYDAAGNTTCRPAGTAANVCPGGAASQTLTWDPEGNLATSTDATGTTSYIYDADGNRLVRRDPTGSTLFLPGQELRYSAGSLTCTRFYTFAGVTVGSRTAAGLTWLASDHQGTALTAISQVTQQSTTRRQTPYGTPRGSSPAWPNSRGFVGGTQDNTGLTHLGAREYDPATGRFISVDPAMDLADPQQWNGYAYAGNSPITRSDPTGLRPEEGNGDPASPSCDYANAYARYYCQSATRGYVSVTLTPAQSFKIFADSYCECDIRDVINAPDDYMKKASLQNVVVQWLCAQAMGITCEEYDLRMHGDVSFTDLVLELTGIQDVIDCSNGNWAGCAWTAVNLASLILPAAKLATAGKAAKVVDVAGDLADARRMGGGLTSADIDSALVCLIEGMSFAPGTAVLMADGSTKPIEKVQPGDRVLATEPETGRTEARTVTKVWVHDDTLLDLRLDGAGTLTTTEDHPFWNETDRQWQKAERLDRGDLLRTPSGARVAAVRLDWNTAHTGRAYNLTVDGLHTYYVVAGLRAVLVHNAGCGRTDLGNGLFQYPDGSIRRSDGTFAGTNGSRVGAEAEKAVWDNLEQQGHKVIRAPVAVRANGQLRIFDGAIDLGNGKLIGIEVKSGGASLSSAQRNFDTWLNTSGSTAATVGNYAGYDVVQVYMWNVP